METLSSRREGEERKEQTGGRPRLMQVLYTRCKGEWKEEIIHENLDLFDSIIYAE